MTMNSFNVIKQYMYIIDLEMTFDHANVINPSVNQ